MMLFKKRPKKIQLKEFNSDIVKRIYNIIYHPNVKNIFTNPAYKLIILNVYHENFDYLMSNILSTSSNNQLLAISFHKYFNINNINVENVLTTLKRSINIISSNKLDDKVLIELNEILSTIENLLEENK